MDLGGSLTSIINNSNTPLVSVIMNCYNGEEFLREAIESVYAQTYLNWEIIFWDNLSTDKSADIAYSFDDKVRYFCSTQTTSLGEARVEAIKRSKGDFISFLDCDDLWMPDKLEKQSALFGNDDLGLIYSRCKVIKKNCKNSGFIPELNQDILSGDVFNDLAKENFVPFVSAVIPKEKYEDVGGFPNGYKISTDYYLFLQLSYKYQVAGIEDVLCEYREHENNLYKKQYVVGAKESISALMDFLPDIRVTNNLKFHYVNLSIMYLKERRFFESIFVLIKHGGWSLFFIRFLRKVKKYINV